MSMRLMRLTGPIHRNFNAFHMHNSTTRYSHPGAPLSMRFVQRVCPINGVWGTRSEPQTVDVHSGFPLGAGEEILAAVPL